MTLENHDFLMLPGWHDYGPDSWQHHWEALLPHVKRVEQHDWDTPRYEDWAKRLSEEVARCSRPVILIAHSLGTSLVMRWAHDADTSAVAGAFLVAPSDRDREAEETRRFKTGFAPMVLEPLPFPSMVIASSNDPHVSIERARVFALAWQSTLVEIGPLSHMGGPENLGNWPAGMACLETFVASLTA